jgi:hypothetical protein
MVLHLFIKYGRMPKEFAYKMINNFMRKLTDEQVKQIFHDSGDTMYFKKKYKVDIRTVKSIKTKEAHKHITKHLENPGQIAKYGLTPEQVDAIFYSEEPYAKLAKTYKIHEETVRNIKNSKTRAFEEWF